MLIWTILYFSLIRTFYNNSHTNLRYRRVNDSVYSVNTIVSYELMSDRELHNPYINSTEIAHYDCTFGLLTG